MPEGDSFKDYVLDQLSGLPGLRAKRMFGGYGLYAEDRFFGIIYQGRCYLKTNVQTRAEFLQRGMESFRPNAQQTLSAYYEVPADVMDRREEFVRWAQVAFLSCAPPSG